MMVYRSFEIKLLVGDSHPAHAIDPDIVSDLTNLSRDGDGYFYINMKVRTLIDANPQIDTLILAYSFIDVTLKRDAWFRDQVVLRSKTTKRFFLFNMQDLWDVVKTDPVEVLVNLPQSIPHSLMNPRRGKTVLGGYSKLTSVRNVGEKLVLNPLAEEEEEKGGGLFDEEPKFSVDHVYYLHEIYKYCESKNVQLVLLNLPLLPYRVVGFAPYKPQYLKVAAELENAILIDHSAFYIPDSGFADANHLNALGSKIYSEYLEKNGFGN